ncbi:MAG: type II secretion system F family protein [Actinobacteria bacterium]|nr:type II secretion system F family protein [Actinomycetota bacterium]
MRRRGVRWALGSAVLLFLALLVAPRAGAQSSGSLFIRKIDSTEPSKTMVDYVATQGDGAAPQVAFNGQQVSPSAVTPMLGANPKPPVGVSLVVDTGPNMSNTNALVSYKAAAKDFVKTSVEKGIEVSVYQAGDRPNLVQSFTTDQTKLDAAIEKLGPTSGSATWGTLRLAAGAYSDNSRLQPNIVLAVGDNDAVTAADQNAARGAIVGIGATVFALEFTGNGMDPAPYDALVSASGGIVSATGDAGQMGPMLISAGDTVANKQFRAVTDPGLSTGAIADVTVTVSGQTAKASIVMGATAQGAQQLNPQVATGGGPLAFLSNGLGLVLGLILFLAAIAFFVYALVLLFVPDNSLSNVLQPYDGFAAEDEYEEEGTAAVAKSALLQRAVELTEQVAESQGYLSRAEAALERANLPLRAGEALFFYLAFVVVVLIVFLALTRNPFAGLVGGLIAALLPPAVVSFLASRRRRAFMQQLPDTLQLLSGTLRAGYSLMQGVEAVSQEVDDPMGVELRRVVTESRLGRPLEESLEGAAERMDSPDFAWAVMAIRIQREVGGNLSELLLTVAETMTARERLRRDVRTLTAEGRMSALVLGILPIGLGFIMFLINPDYMGQLYKTTLGIIFSIAALVAMAIGFFWMKKIIDIEI